MSDSEIVRFTCPHCGKVNKAPIKAVGFGGTCSKCGGGVQVPGVKKSPRRPSKPEPSIAVIDDSDDVKLIDVNLNRPPFDDGDMLQGLAIRKPSIRQQNKGFLGFPWYLWAIQIFMTAGTVAALVYMAQNPRRVYIFEDGSPAPAPNSFQPVIEAKAEPERTAIVQVEANGTSYRAELVIAESGAVRAVRSVERLPAYRFPPDIAVIRLPDKP